MDLLDVVVVVVVLSYNVGDAAVTVNCEFLREFYYFNTTSEKYYHDFFNSEKLKFDVTDRRKSGCEEVGNYIFWKNPHKEVAMNGKKMKESKYWIGLKFNGKISDFENKHYTCVSGDYKWNVGGRTTGFKAYEDWSRIMGEQQPDCGHIDFLTNAKSVDEGCGAFSFLYSEEPGNLAVGWTDENCKKELPSLCMACKSLDEGCDLNKDRNSKA